MIIVGAGPVGLFLACCLAESSLTFCVVERAHAVELGSRSIGIHPPALERAHALGLADALVAAGVRIERAHVYTDSGRIGTFELGTIGGPFPFVLSIPQQRTMHILVDHLERVRPGAVVYGASVRDVVRSDDGAAMELVLDGHASRPRGRIIAACDGKDSCIRRVLGLPMARHRFDGGYIMGDFVDDTQMGDDAALFLAPDGLVECFPLPDHRRRWVASDPHDRACADTSRLCHLVRTRTGIVLRTDEPVTAFGVEQGMAARFAIGRVVLVGDAAHVVSPFGGQGMNLGWLDAYRLAALLPRVLAGRRPTLRRYERQRRKAARRALRRGAFNTIVGRAHNHPRAQRAVARALLRHPLDYVAARAFTMRGLS